MTRYYALISILLLWHEGQVLGINDGESSANPNCPPEVVSHREEVHYFCSNMTSTSIVSRNYRCKDETGEVICQGTIDSHVELPTCSQPTIASCGDLDLFEGIEGSKGPCLPSESFYRKSAYCNADWGAYACFDSVKQTWCRGNVDATATTKQNVVETMEDTTETSHEASDETYTCPPKVVSHQEEVHLFCSRFKGSTTIESGLFNCTDKSGAVVCNGSINAELALPSCSQPTIRSCHEQFLFKGMMGSGPCMPSKTFPERSAYCDAEEEEFACFDVVLETWCQGFLEAPAEDGEDEYASPLGALQSCPPEEVSHEQEVHLFCSSIHGAINIKDGKYDCTDESGAVLCHGSIDPEMEQPLCSQPTISSCGKYDLFDGLKGTYGPCMASKLFYEKSAYCDAEKGEFACYDVVRETWCHGNVGEPTEETEYAEVDDEPEESEATNELQETKENEETAETSSFESTVSEACPPAVVSHREEVHLFCSSFTGSTKVESGNYNCTDHKGAVVCHGRINPDMELPSCSQPTITSCLEADLFDGLKDSSGPCSPSKVFREKSAYCDVEKGEFACFDVIQQTWCQGHVESPTGDITKIEQNFGGSIGLQTCPPEIVSHYEEVHLFCNGYIGSSTIDGDEYKCKDQTGTVVCQGRIIPDIDLPKCSRTVPSCDNVDLFSKHNGPCLGSLTFAEKSAHCSQGEGKFACFDVAQQTWCQGHVVAPAEDTNKTAATPAEELSELQTCPPNIVTHEEEVHLFCSGLTGSISIKPGKYKCKDDTGAVVCKGHINPDKDLPSCSQPKVSSCEVDDLFHKQGSSGPCLASKMFPSKSAYCDADEGEFFCFDVVQRTWCQGHVDSPTEDAEETTTTTTAAAESSEAYSCPPEVVSHEEEVHLFCSLFVGSSSILSDIYRCMDEKGTVVCQGQINPDIALPTCSQPAIPSCKKKHVFDGIEGSSGPCMPTKENPKRSAYCDDEKGEYACFDVVQQTWCQGQVGPTKENTNDEASPTESSAPQWCPPEVISHKEELNLFCNGEGYTTILDNQYTCQDEQGNIICKGSFDQDIVVPTCSQPMIESCDDHDVFDGLKDSAGPCLPSKHHHTESAYCDAQLGEFACWDVVHDRWCQGDVRTIREDTSTLQPSKPSKPTYSNGSVDSGEAKYVPPQDGKDEKTVEELQTAKQAPYQWDEAKKSSSSNGTIYVGLAIACLGAGVIYMRSGKNKRRAMGYEVPPMQNEHVEMSSLC